MNSNPFDGISRPSLPTLSDIERRMVELTGKQLRLKPQPQRQTRPAPSTPRRPCASSNPILGDEALYGVAGLAESLAEEESHDGSTTEETTNEESMQQQT
jgi:hypothetical protein